MEYTSVLTAVIYAITAVGCVLGTYVTYKIYSKDGFR